MKTINQMKKEINVSEILKNDKYGTFEGIAENSIVDISLASELTVIINNLSERTQYKISEYNRVNSFEIKSEKVIELLRELYKSTKNNFVKSVIETVGKTKKYSEKQICIITDELVKNENIIINF